MRIAIIAVGKVKQPGLRAEIDEYYIARIDAGLQGTFPLADDGQYEPARNLRTALEEKGITQDRFLVLKNGESRVFGH